VPIRLTDLLPPVLCSYESVKGMWAHVVVVFVCLLATSHSQEEQAEHSHSIELSSSIFSRYGLAYHPPEPSRAAPGGPGPVAIFVHAAVGIFPVKRRRPGGPAQWGFGREILEEIMTSLASSGLLARPRTSVHVTLLGGDADVALALDTLRRFNGSHNIRLLLRGRDLYTAELPSIHALHMHAAQSDPRWAAATTTAATTTTATTTATTTTNSAATVATTTTAAAAATTTTAADTTTTATASTTTTAASGGGGVSTLYYHYYYIISLLLLLVTQTE
jgi:hypothetical protein